MITFEDAREIVQLTDGQIWSGPGRFWVDPTGREDATHFYVAAGAYEDLVQGQIDFLNFSPVARFVDKQTGRLTHEPLISVQKRIEAMAPITATT